MSLTRDFGSMDKEQLTALLDFYGRELFLRQIAALGDASNQLLDLIKEILDDEGLDELAKAREVLEGGGETTLPPETKQGTDSRELLAQSLEQKGPWGTPYAAALRGAMHPLHGIKILSAMLNEPRIDKKYRNKQNTDSPIRLALAAAFNALAKETIERKKWAKKEVKRLMNAFTNACKEKNVRGMQNVLKDLDNAYIQGALIQEVGGVQNRTHLLNAYQGSIDRVIGELVK